MLMGLVAEAHCLYSDPQMDSGTVSNTILSGDLLFYLFGGLYRG